MTRTSWLRPPLVAAYGAWWACASRPDTEERKTIRPYPAAHISRPTACPVQYAVDRFRLTRPVQASSSRSRMGSRLFRPTACRNTCIDPSRPAASLTTRRHASGSVRSAASTSRWPPCSLTRCPSSARRAWSTSTARTLAPSLASAKALAPPRPPAPAMSTVRSRISSQSSTRGRSSTLLSANYPIYFQGVKVDFTASLDDRGPVLRLSRWHSRADTVEIAPSRQLTPGGTLNACVRQPARRGEPHPPPVRPHTAGGQQPARPGGT